MTTNSSNRQSSDLPFTLLVGVSVVLLILFSGVFVYNQVFVETPATEGDTGQILSLLEVILSVVGVLLPLAIGIMGYIYRLSVESRERYLHEIEDLKQQARDAADSAERSTKQLERLQEKFMETQAKTESSQQTVNVLSSRVQHALDRDEEMDKDLNRMVASIEGNNENIQAAKSDVQDLQRQVERTLQDIQDYKVELDKSKDDLEKLTRRQETQQRQLLPLFSLKDVYEKRLDLFSDDDMKVSTALLGLLEYRFVTNPEDDRSEDRFIRYLFIASLLGVDKMPKFTEYGAEIIAVLNEISENDPDPGIRHEAKRLVRKLKPFTNKNGRNA